MGKTTKKIRISVSLEAHLAVSLKRLAHRCNMSMSRAAAVIVEHSLQTPGDTTTQDAPDIAEEISREMREMTDAEAPQYGQRTKRKPRRNEFG